MPASYWRACQRGWSQEAPPTRRALPQGFRSGLSFRLGLAAPLGCRSAFQPPALSCVLASGWGGREEGGRSRREEERGGLHTPPSLPTQSSSECCCCCCCCPCCCSCCYNCCPPEETAWTRRPLLPPLAIPSYHGLFTHIATTIVVIIPREGK